LNQVAAFSFFDVSASGITPEVCSKHQADMDKPDRWRLTSHQQIVTTCEIKLQANGNKLPSL
jgi:hypothetical protein